MQPIGFIVTPGFQVMSLAALSVFEFANLTAEAPYYDVHMLSLSGGRVVSSLGMPVETQRLDERHFDTVLVSGDMTMSPASPQLIAYLRWASREVRRVASICTGAFLLAEAGLLDGRRATTHWARAPLLRERFPKSRVEADRIYIVDGPIWTSAGMSAGIDLALGMVEQDLGAEIARAVAKRLVVYHRRAGGQSQYSALLDISPRSDRIQSALDYARSHLAEPLSVEQLAEVVHLSPRQFSRQFRAETGKSPAKAIEQLRVEAARLMLEQGRHALEVVARETGFGDRERMRRAFMRAFGQSPQMIRRTFGEAISA